MPSPDSPTDGQRPPSEHRNLKNMIAGAGSGCVSATVTCPLDVVKTRLQNHALREGAIPLYRNTFDALRSIAAHEGIRGLYRGLGPTVTGYLSSWAVYFTAYDALKTTIAQRTDRSIDSSVVHILSAMGAGATSTSITNPIWVIKTRFMSQNGSQSRRYRNMGHAFMSILREEGYRGFYRGMGTSLLGLSHVMVHFPLYERLKLWLRTVPAFSHPGVVSAATSAPVVTNGAASLKPQDRAPRPSDHDHDHVHGHDHAHPYAGRTAPRSSAEVEADTGRIINKRGILVASILSKLTASVVTYPHEVIRTRLQNQYQPPYRYQGLVHAVVTILREEGWRAFYRGLGTNLIRTVPASAVTLMTYELLIRWL
ncbi:hypothetical protein IWQ60_007819 [Tieghemiomyces parasiticus]|uniref:Uncharacterized protein n=1 Tax=Tieghemiomyces parasiticus TaxID=78921 RepID=A0A9W8DT72_9FUNG|nr:hypothetical protein IWQ60_007819 [Tieghemiomyces parasiticus]